MSLSTAFLEYGISWAQFSTDVTQIHGPSMYLLSMELKSLGELRKAWTSCACCYGNAKLSHPFELVVSLLAKSEQVYKPTQQLLTRLLLWNCVTTWQSPTETHLKKKKKKKGFLRTSAVKNLPAAAGDAGFIPGSGRYPGEGNGNPLQYSCLGNPLDGEAWWATVYG